MTPVWLFDVDGVIADFSGAVDRVAESIGLERAKWDHPKISVNYPDHAQQLLAACRNVGFARGIPEYPGAIEALRDAMCFARVVFVTTPMAGSATWAWDRTQWLRERLGDVEVVFAEKKDLVRGDLFVEDTPDNARTWWDCHPQAQTFLVRRPYNKAWHLANFAVDNLSDVFERVCSK